jgi:hypothetical protein
MFYKCTAINRNVAEQLILYRYCHIRPLLDGRIFHRMEEHRREAQWPVYIFSLIPGSVFTCSVRIENNDLLGLHHRTNSFLEDPGAT